METMKARDYKEDLSQFLKDYDYQPGLTKRLDNLVEANGFSQEIINEVVLWKVDRYADVDEVTLGKLNKLKSLSNGQHKDKDAEDTLRALLERPGINLPSINLPMASTMLRFRNPRVFQIIDQHAYRAVYGKRYPKRLSYATTKADEKICVYFNYLDELSDLCERKGFVFAKS